MASGPGSPCQCFGFTLTFSSSKNIVLSCCYEEYPHEQQETNKLTVEANGGTESRKYTVESAEKTEKLQRKMCHLSDA